MKKKLQIFSPDWLDIHPYHNTIQSDLYYTKLANRVLDALSKTLQEIEDQHYLALTDDEQKKLSCILTAYFEDIISESNIWNSFTRITQAKTGQWLPFYDTSDYADEEINEADIQLLCWHFYTQINESQIAISPLEPLFKAIAQAIYPIFDEEFESAPANDTLKEFFTLSDDATLFEVQEKFFWLGTESYLFGFNSRDLEKELNEVMVVAEENQMQDHLPEMVNMVMTDFSFNNVTELHRQTAAQWLGHMIGEEHDLYEALINMPAKKSGYFIFQDQDSMYAQFKHVATDEIIQVTNRSLAGYPKDLKSNEVVIYAGFVEWQGEWWFVGDLRGYDAEAELLDEIKARPEEQTLFDITSEETFDTAEMDRLVDSSIESLRQEHPEEDELDLYWSLLFDPEIPSSYLKEAILSDRFPQLTFPDLGGNGLMKNNLDFVLDYFKRA